LETLSKNTTGSSNTAVGRDALEVNTTGSENTAVGRFALTSNTEGDENTAIGRYSLGTNTTGEKNTALGHSTVENNTTGDFNVGIGYGALQANTTADNNTAVGYQSLDANTTGVENAALGTGALGANTTGIHNTGIGNASLAAQNGAACFNTALGSQSGLDVTTGDNNILIGYNSGRSVSPFTVTTQDGRMVLGNNSITNAYIKVALTVTSDLRDKTNFGTVPHGLDFVNKLEPVSFQFKKSRENDTPSGLKKYGFKAQDILELEGEDNVIIDNEQPELLKMTNSHLVPVLVNAIKELKAEIDELKKGS